MLLFFVFKFFNQVKLTGAIKLTFDFSLTFPLFIPFMKLRLGSNMSLSVFYGPEALLLIHFFFCDCSDKHFKES